METLTKQIDCPYCGYGNQLKNPGRYYGKKIALVCAHSACKKNFVTELGLNNIESHSSPDSTIYIPLTKYVKKASLKIHQDNLSDIEINLESRKYIIGRGSSGEDDTNERIILNDPYVSRNHCMIWGQENNPKRIQFILKDLGSKNKTKLNDQELKENEVIYLENGDEIKIGNCKIQYVEEENN
ncbi:MAG TPA: FHA domain-containing protein [Saprospiraceae bacterium]|nr:FHA domain-containing protein [Saprospiraceae bacterium]